MKPYRKSFGIWVPDRKLTDNRGFISPGVVGAMAGARRRTAPAGVPAFVSENTRGKEITGSTTKVITLASSISVGNRIVVVYNAEHSGTSTPTGCVDDASTPNTYSLMQTVQQYNIANSYTTIYSAPVTSALSAGSQVTISFTGSPYSYKSWAVFVLSGCASTGQPDQTASGSSYGTSIAVAASPASSPTLLFGVVKSLNSKTYTLGSGWTQSGAAHDNDDNYRYWYVYKAVTGTSSQDIGGSLSANEVWYAMWSAFK